jgi:hypothetical protein
MIVKYSLGEAASVKIPGTNKKDPVIHGHGISQKTGEGKGRSEEAGSSGVAGVAGVQELQEFRSAGVQECRGSGVAGVAGGGAGAGGVWDELTWTVPAPSAGSGTSSSVLRRAN